MMTRSMSKSIKSKIFSFKNKPNKNITEFPTELKFYLFNSLTRKYYFNDYVVYSNSN